MHWQIGSMSCEKTDSFHREHTQHEAETLEIIGPIAMERIFTARKCTGRIGSHWKWSEWLNHPSLRVEPCREAPHWSLLFQSGARLCAGIAQSKKTQKNHIRSTLLTHVRLFLATLYPCLECLYSFHFDDLGIVSLLFPFAYIRYQNFWAASCIINSHRENNESASHPVGFLECWEKPGQLHSFRNGWMSFSRFFNQVHLGDASTFFWMAETLQNCTERLNGVALRTYRRTKPPILRKQMCILSHKSLGVNLWHSTISARKWVQVQHHAVASATQQWKKRSHQNVSSSSQTWQWRITHFLFPAN